MKHSLKDRCREYEGRKTDFIYADLMWYSEKWRKVNRKKWKKQTMFTREFYRIMEEEDGKGSIIG